MADDTRHFPIWTATAHIFPSNMITYKLFMSSRFWRIPRQKTFQMKIYLNTRYWGKMKTPMEKKKTVWWRYRKELGQMATYLVAHILNTHPTVPDELLFVLEVFLSLCTHINILCDQDKVLRKHKGCKLRLASTIKNERLHTGADGQEFAWLLLCASLPGS